MKSPLVEDSKDVTKKLLRVITASDEGEKWKAVSIIKHLCGNGAVTQERIAISHTTIDDLLTMVPRICSEERLLNIGNSMLGLLEVDPDSSSTWFHLEYITKRVLESVMCVESKQKFFIKVIQLSCLDENRTMNINILEKIFVDVRPYIENTVVNKMKMGLNDQGHEKLSLPFVKLASESSFIFQVVTNILYQFLMLCPYHLVLLVIETFVQEVQACSTHFYKLYPAECQYLVPLLVIPPMYYTTIGSMEKVLQNMFELYKQGPTQVCILLTHFPKWDKHFNHLILNTTLKSKPLSSE